MVTRTTNGQARPDSSTFQMRLTINGRQRDFGVEPLVTLLDLLREQEDLTGTKRGVIMASAVPALF
jgi:aerobic-type carbon monoxide dehydrogenase small subunit (CoxS/CutS family)